MTNQVSKFVFWTPRILSILFILFLAIFSLDVFEPGTGAGDIALGLLIHNIPSLVLLIILIISWKYEIVGGIVFILAGAAYMATTIFNEVAWYLAIAWSMQIAGPAFLIGILFLINWKKKKSEITRKIENPPREENH